MSRRCAATLVGACAALLFGLLAGRLIKPAPNDLRATLKAPRLVVKP